MNTVEPIKSLKKIDDMKKILKAQNPRDYLLFLIGINTGLRISDLLKLRMGDMISGKKIKDYTIIREKKTGKEKKFMLNNNVKKALKEYMDQGYITESEDYLFKSRKGVKPITGVQAWQILNKAARSVGINDRIGTHTLRKTFGYHAYQQGTDITLLQKVFNHSAPSITLRYIGITQEDIDNVYVNLNL